MVARVSRGNRKRKRGGKKGTQGKKEEGKEKGKITPRNKFLFIVLYRFRLGLYWPTQCRSLDSVTIGLPLTVMYANWELIPMGIAVIPILIYFFPFFICIVATDFARGLQRDGKL